MLLREMNPFIRYVRNLALTRDSSFEDVVPLDARLFFTLDGCGKIKVEDTVYEMSARSLVVINSGISYRIIAPEHHVNYIAINFDFTQNANAYTAPIPPVPTDSFKREMLVDHIFFEDAAVFSKVLYLKEIPVIQKDLKTIAEEQMQKLLYYEIRSSHILAQVLTESIRFSELRGITDKNENATSVLCFIQENYQNNLTYQWIGRHFGYHPNYISFMIKRLTGMTLHQYLTYVRLTNAAYFLENTALSCSEIAKACGFVDSSHFSRCFKNHFGTPPSRHRSI